MSDLAGGYIKYCDIHITRLLNLLDRDSFSPTAGCFDRPYWHQKIKDFPSATNQMGIHALAIVYSHPKSKYYKSTYILSLVEMGISYLGKIQKKDGSFDEWYVNERGWAGPTGYVVHSSCRTFELMSELISPESRDQLISVIESGGNHLCVSTEKQVITNHIAIALVALYEAYKITSLEKFYEAYKKLLPSIVSNHTEEGWSLEYDGPDVGYQSATTSFLAHIHKHNKDEKLKAICLQSIEFISNFVLPNGEICNTIGSRNTVTHFFFAYEYWKDVSESASHLSKLIKNNSVGPLLHDHEDHYFIYRLTEMLESALVEDNKRVSSDGYQLFSEKKNTIKKEYRKAKITILNNSKYYLAINMLKGGAVHLYDKTLNQSKIDAGIIFLNKTGSVFTSDLNDQNNTISQYEERVIVRGRMKKVPTRIFNPYTFIMFRMFMLAFGQNSKVATYIKSCIKSILITPISRSGLEFEREIIIEDNINTLKIKNKVFSKKMFTGKVFSGGFFYTRYVPQSKYFRSDDNLNQTKLMKEVQGIRLISFEREF